MKAYIIVVVIASALIVFINSIFTSFGFGWILLWMLAGLVGLYVLDTILAGIVMIVPRKIYNPFSKRAKVFKFEKKFYEKIGIRNWKDKIPIGKGPLGNGRRKDKVTEINNINYLAMFMMDSYRAEIMHAVQALVAWLLLVIYPFNLLTISIPIAVVHTVLQVLPICVQRYNRPRLTVAFERAKRSDEQFSKETDNSKIFNQIISAVKNN